MTWFYNSPLENEGGLQTLKEPGVGTESDLPSGQERGLPVFHLGPTPFIYFFYFHWFEIPLPMYYWEYLFNFGFKCFALRLDQGWKSSLYLSKSNSSSGPRWALGLFGIMAPSFCSFCISSNGHLKNYFLSFHFKVKRLLQKVRDK